MKKVAWGILYVFIVVVVAAVTAYYFCTRIELLSRTFKNNPGLYSVWGPEQLRLIPSQG